MRTRLILALSLLGSIPVVAQETVIEWPRIVISVAARRLWVVDEWGDTLRSGPAAVGSGRVLRSGARRWVFRTPKGETVVTAKEVAPDWIPPDWHYVELARKKKLKIGRLLPSQPVALPSGEQLMARGAVIGILGADSVFRRFPAKDDIIVGGTLYIPPLGTRNRRVPGELGPYRLLLANGVGVHGTRYTETVGKAATHGCIRLHDEDITWLHANVPVGTRVIIQ